MSIASYIAMDLIWKCVMLWMLRITTVRWKLNFTTVGLIPQYQLISDGKQKANKCTTFLIHNIKFWQVVKTQDKHFFLKNDRDVGMKKAQKQDVKHIWNSIPTFHIVY